MPQHARLFLLAGLFLTAIAGCQCEGTLTTHTDGGAGGSDDGGPGSGSDDGGVNGGDGGGGGGGCAGGAACPDGLSCLAGGVCCDAPEHLCGHACCTGGTVCLFDSCVTPGQECHTSGECGTNAYCETALGDGGVMQTSDGGVCSQPLASPGRCLPLPPVCAADGGTSADAGCVAACEYRPVAQKLDAVMRWHWMPKVLPDFADVWSTPVVGRLYDANCDGKVDLQDPPNVVFVSGNTHQTCCQCTGLDPSPCRSGVLRVLDGRTGEELWMLDKAEPTSVGFAAMSIALGDVNGDGRLEILAPTGEGKLAVIDATGKVLALSTDVIPNATAAAFGWGGGLAVADMDGDGNVEVAYGNLVFSITPQGIVRRFKGTAGSAGGISNSLSTFADLDGADGGALELLAGRTAYLDDGGILWNNTTLPDGYNAVADFDGDGKPEVVLVGQGNVWILDATTGQPLFAPLALSGTGTGGPPTVADFDGDGRPEIGVAQQNYYFALKVDLAAKSLSVLWQTPNHDFSSSITGSTVFDFEGDSSAEVVYNDECYLWVFDGKTGAIRFAHPTDSFTGTEASLVADVDGDGRAEMLMISNGVDPGPGGSWKCAVAPWNQDDPDAGRPAWTPPPDGGISWRGVSLFGDRANGWVGTRALWNEHTYHVSNVCDDRDTACGPNAQYGAIPKHEASNWQLPWLNNFRQNVLEAGLFNAPDAVVSLGIDCASPLGAKVSVRNAGLASLPAGVQVEVVSRRASGDVRQWLGQTSHALNPGQTEVIDAVLDPDAQIADDFVARIVVDPAKPNFRECRTDNDESAIARAGCIN